MRFIQYVLAPMVLFLEVAGCRDQASGANEPVVQSAPIPDSLARRAMNAYTGHRGDGLITVVINYISAGMASGYDVQRGRRRNFNGGVTLEGAALHFDLEEAGDQPGKFSLVLDTAGRKLEGRALQKGEWQRLTATRPPDESYITTSGTWVSAGAIDFRDSILTLRFDGLCYFRFYQRPWDSTSQMITIRGNYERLRGDGESYRVEWEENSYLKPADGLLVVKKEMFNGYRRSVLTGNGLRLTRYVPL
jgi:hypothetical protein